MKIGIDARLWGTANTGIGRYTQKLIENLQEIDAENKYVVFCRRKDFESIKVAPTTKKVVADIPHYSFSEQTVLMQIFLSEKLDLLHTPHFNVPILYPRPFVITIHDILWHKTKSAKATNLPQAVYWGKYAAYRVAVKIAVSRAKKIIVPSHAVKNDLVYYFPQSRKKIAVTYEGALEKYGEVSINNKVITKYKVEKPYLLYVGNLYPHKNVENLVRALLYLNRPETLSLRLSKLTHLSQLRLVIVCTRGVFMDKFRRFLEKQKSLHLVKVLNSVNDKELANLYQCAEAFVFPTLSEGFGLPGLEAMQYGCPVVCSNIPVLREVYGNAAKYFNPQDPKDIASKIIRVTTDDKARHKLIDKGNKRAKKYSWKKMAEQTLDVYKEVLGE